MIPNSSSHDPALSSRDASLEENLRFNTSVSAGSVQEDGFSRIHAALLLERRHGRKRLLLWSWVIRVGVLVAILGGWQLSADLGFVSAAVASDPAQVATYLVHTLPTAALWINVWATFQAVLLGLVIGAVAGILLGILFYEVEVIKKGLDPFVTFINSLPRPALAPVFLLWFGLGVGAKVAVSISIVVFVLLLNTIAGLQGTNDDLLFLAASLDMSRWQRLRLIQLPSAAPAIIAGLRLGAVYSVLGVVVSELVAAYQGLGQLLVTETNKFDLGGAFGILLLLGVLATGLNQLVSILERRVSWGREEIRS